MLTLSICIAAYVAWSAVCTGHIFKGLALTKSTLSVHKLYLKCPPLARTHAYEIFLATGQ